jgi:hypothetical protein
MIQILKLNMIRRLLAEVAPAPASLSTPPQIIQKALNEGR